MRQALEGQVAQLFATMNDVAVGHGDWLDVVGAMGPVLDVRLATIELFDKRTGLIQFICTEVVDAAHRQLYEEHIAAVNPRLTLAPGARIGQIVSDRLIDPDVDASAGEYYEWLRPTGTRYFAGAKLFETPEYLALSSIHVPERDGPVEASTEQLYAKLLPQLSNALLVHQALAPNADPAALDDGALGSSRAYALLDSAGRILECSAGFKRIIGGSGVLALHEGRLGAARGSDHGRLNQLIGAAIEPAPSAAPLSPVRLQTADGRHGLLIRAVRLNRGRELFARLRPVAMLVLIDLDAPAACVAGELSAAWGLTPREAELAMLIADGRRIEQAAAMLGITELTARTHLKAIYRRMDIDHQAELARLVTRLGG